MEKKNCKKSEPERESIRTIGTCGEKTAGCNWPEQAETQLIL